MYGWHWHVTDTENPAEPPIAEGHVRPGMNQSPAVIVSEMISAVVNSRWVFIESVDVGAHNHDGDLSSTYHLSDGTQLYATITPAT